MSFPSWSREYNAQRQKHHYYNQGGRLKNRIKYFMKRYNINKSEFEHITDLEDRLLYLKERANQIKKQKQDDRKEQVKQTFEKSKTKVS